MQIFIRPPTPLKRGQYKSFDDAMEGVTGERPKKVDIDDFDEKWERIGKIKVDDE